MLHGSRVYSFPVFTIIRTAVSFNKSAAKMRTVKCYNIVHKALMIPSFLWPSIPLSPPFTWFEISPLLALLSRSSEALGCHFFLIFCTFLLSNNALLTLMVPYASDGPAVVVVCSLGRSHLLNGWFDKLDQGSNTDLLCARILLDVHAVRRVPVSPTHVDVQEKKNAFLSLVCSLCLLSSQSTDSVCISH